MLNLVEREGHWIDTRVTNFGLSREDIELGFAERVHVPKPEITDRATAAALLAGFGSTTVWASHANWRIAADQIINELDLIGAGMNLSDPTGDVPSEQLKPVVEELQPKEHSARRNLAEAIAHELGHRQPEKRLRIFTRP